MRVVSYAVSLLCLYVVVHGWSFLRGVHFLFPIGIVVALLAIGVMFIVSAEDRKIGRSDSIFEDMCYQFEKEVCVQ